MTSQHNKQQNNQSKQDKAENKNDSDHRRPGMWIDYFQQKHTEDMTADKVLAFKAHAQQYLEAQPTLKDFGQAVRHLAQAGKEQGFNLRWIMAAGKEWEDTHLIRFDCFMWDEQGESLPLNYGADILIDKERFQ